MNSAEQPLLGPTIDRTRARRRTIGLLPELDRAGRYLVLTVGSVIMVIPLYLMLATSFKSTTEFYRNPFGLPGSISAQNYLSVWFTGHMNLYFRNSVIISIGTVGITLVFSTLASYALARMRMRGSTIIFYLLLATLMVPTEIILLPLFIEFRDLHLLNTYGSLIIPYASLGMAFSTYLLRGFFKTLPEELAEAARIDGSTELETFWYVMLPLALPGVATVAIFSFMGAWSEFFLASIFISNPDLRPITAGLLGFSSSYQTDWGATSAGYTIVIAPIVVVFLLLQRFFIRGLTFGALKG